MERKYYIALIIHASGCVLCFFVYLVWEIFMFSSTELI